MNKHFIFSRFFKAIFFVTIFVALTQAITFDCMFNVYNGAVIGNQYGCLVHSLMYRASEDLQFLTNVTGNHLSGRSSTDVRRLIVNDQDILKRIPGQINDFFPIILSLELNNGNLEVLLAEDLKQFPNLIVLDIQRQKVKTLDGDSFSNTLWLQMINFNGNLLKNVGIGLLQGLSALNVASFQGNVCIDAQARNANEIPELNRKLLELCPPSKTSQPTTTTDLPQTMTTTDSQQSTITTVLPPPISQECPIGCSEQIEFLKNQFAIENQELREKVSAQGRKIEDLSAETFALRQVNAAYEARLVEIEKQMREVNANPRASRSIFSVNQKLF